VKRWNQPGLVSEPMRAGLDVRVELMIRLNWIHCYQGMNIWLFAIGLFAHKIGSQPHLIYQKVQTKYVDLTIIFLNTSKFFPRFKAK
jgi:hypothetical protein